MPWDVTNNNNGLNDHLKRNAAIVVADYSIEERS
jgi:hypothetical protein